MKKMVSLLLAAVLAAGTLSACKKTIRNLRNPRSQSLSRSIRTAIILYRTLFPRSTARWILSH